MDPNGTRWLQDSASDHGKIMGFLGHEWYWELGMSTLMNYIELPFSFNSFWHGATRTATKNCTLSCYSKTINDSDHWVSPVMRPVVVSYLFRKKSHTPCIHIYLFHLHCLVRLFNALETMNSLWLCIAQTVLNSLVHLNALDTYVSLPEEYVTQKSKVIHVPISMYICSQTINIIYNTK